jgi:hypothetical protein
MSSTDRIYLTVLPRVVPGDTYFPEFSESDFKVIKSEFIDAVVPYNFYIYERIHARQYLANKQGPMNERTLQRATTEELRAVQ